MILKMENKMWYMHKVPEEKNIQMYNWGKLFYTREHNLTLKTDTEHSIPKYILKKLLNFKDKQRTI